MDRHTTSKRPRESSPSVIGNTSEKRLRGGGDGRGDSSGGGRLLDLDLSFGVFDFPWLKESLINSKSEDWKFEDSFDGVSVDAAFTVETAFTELPGQLVWCNLPDPWAVEFEAHAALDGGGTAGEGMDCVWRSLLNQPLQQGSSSAL